MKLKIQPHSNQGSELIITIYNETDSDVTFRVGQVTVYNEENKPICVERADLQGGVSLLKSNGNLNVSVYLGQPIKKGYLLKYTINEKCGDTYSEFVHIYRLNSTWEKEI